MIAIDYVPGSHGHFLSWVCNRCLTDLPLAVLGSDPFSDSGTSHDVVEHYWQSRVFCEEHYYANLGHWSLPVEQGPGLAEWQGPVIQIWFEHQDLLTLTATCFLRAGDAGIDINELEHDTYGKLDSDAYRSVLRELQRISLESLQTGIARVRDTDWPRVKTWQDWDNLPQHLRNECRSIHGLRPWRLDNQHRDCPRWVLREYFRNSFRNKARNGFIGLRDSMRYHHHARVWRWHFRDFFQSHLFIQALENLAEWLDTPVRDLEVARDVHARFLSQHRYRDSLSQCEAVIESWQQGRDHDLTSFDLLQQAWIECQIEQITGRDLHQDRVEYWQDLGDIRSFLA